MYYYNRELTENLGINLARWKRWSREFLPPDPLGGLQSGFARQYSLKEAFQVYLGGHLVAELKYGVSQAKKILTDLREWINANGPSMGLHHIVVKKKDMGVHIQQYQILITPQKSGPQNGSLDFYYQIQGIISDTPEQYEGVDVRKQLYVETVLGQGPADSDTEDNPGTRCLKFTVLQNIFIRRVEAI